MNHGGLAGFDFDWSPDSRWVSYSRPTGDANNAIFLYDTRDSKLTRATTGYLNDNAADVRSGRQVPLLRVRPRVRRRSTAASTTAGPTPTRPASSRCRCERTSSRRCYARNDSTRRDTKKAERRRSPKEKKDEARQGSEAGQRRARRSQERRHRPRRLRGPRRRPAAGGRQLRGSAGDQGQAALPPPAADRVLGDQEPDRLLRLHRARGEAGARGRRRVRGDGGRQEDAGRLPEPLRDPRDQDAAEVREADRHRRHGSAGRSARRVEADVRGRLPLPARLLLRRRACTASTGRR